MATAGIKRSFTLELWSQVFGLLSWLWPFTWVCFLSRRAKGSYRSGGHIVDLWVHGHVLVSVLLLAFLRCPNLSWWEAVFLVYGGLRVFEIVTYQINVLLFDEYRRRKKGEDYVLRGYRRLVILLLMNYVEIVFWFALFYRNLDWIFNTNGVVLNSFFQAINLSFVTMTTFGSTSVLPKDTFANAMVLSQSAIGLFMALLVLARFIGVLPTPRSMDELENK